MSVKNEFLLPVGQRTFRLRDFGVLRTAFLLAAAWLIMVALPSNGEVRGWLVAPLYVHDDDAAGEIAYVMADGYAYLERLRAAADLYHLHQVPAIYILDEQAAAGYNFVAGKLEKRVDRAIEYLSMQGVPREAIHTVPEPQNALLGQPSLMVMEEILSLKSRRMAGTSVAPLIQRARPSKSTCS